MLKTTLPMNKISVVSTDKIVTRRYKKWYIFLHDLSGKVKACMWRNVTTNRTTIFKFTMEGL